MRAAVNPKAAPAAWFSRSTPPTANRAPYFERVHQHAGAVMHAARPWHAWQDAFSVAVRDASATDTASQRGLRSILLKAERELVNTTGTPYRSAITLPCGHLCEAHEVKYLYKMRQANLRMAAKYVREGDTENAQHKTDAAKAIYRCPCTGCRCSIGETRPENLPAAAKEMRFLAILQQYAPNGIGRAVGAALDKIQATLRQEGIAIPRGNIGRAAPKQAAQPPRAQAPRRPEAPPRWGDPTPPRDHDSPQPPKSWGEFFVYALVFVGLLLLTIFADDKQHHQGRHED